MDAPLNEWQRGWREARWGFYFSVALVPCTLVAVLLAYAVQGPAAVGPNPSALAWILCLPATLAALVWAGYKDGLESRLGRYVWAILILLLGWAILRRMVGAQESERKVNLAIGDRRYSFTLAITVHEDDEEPVNRIFPRDGRWFLSPLAKV